jgi:hypothetical protein
MAATLIVLAKLFATALMAATCSNIFFAAKNTFCSNFAFLAATFVAAKNDISCSGLIDEIQNLWSKSVVLVELHGPFIRTKSLMRQLLQYVYKSVIQSSKLSLSFVCLSN